MEIEYGCEQSCTDRRANALHRCDPGPPEYAPRYAVDDPVRHYFSDTAAGTNALGIKATGNKKVIHLGRWSQKMQIVGRETLGAIKESAYSRSFKSRQGSHPANQVLFDIVNAAGEFVETEILGDAIHGTSAGIVLEPAYDHFTGFFLEVDALVKISQHRTPTQSVYVIRHHVEVFTCIERQIDANFCGDIP